MNTVTDSYEDNGADRGPHYPWSNSCNCGCRDSGELPWLGDVDRRYGDDVEFCDEGEYAG